MSKPGKNFRRGKKKTVYHFVGELIVEGKYAWFVNREGRFRIKWDNAVERYIEYRAKKNPSYDLNIDRKKASNSFREGLLRRYCNDADGAKEYEDCQKVGENKKIVEREFQMPSKVFHSLFGTSEELPGDQMSPKVFQSPFGSKEELSFDSNHETSSCASTSSEVDEKLQVFPDSGISDASDTGFEEAMDVSDDSFDMNATGTAPQGNKREDPVDLTNVATPCQIFHFSDEFSDEELLHSVLEDISTHSDSDVNQPEVVRDISPSSGSVKGGIQFHIILEKALPDKDKTGVAYFFEIGEVLLERINPYTFSGFVPAAKEAGSVPVTVHTGAGRKLGVTLFEYVDVEYEVFKQFIEDPAQLREYANMWSQANEIIGINSNVVQILGLFGLSDQVSIDEQESSRMQPKDDDNQSGYFADAETSSCGSLDLVGDWSDLEEENGACTKDEDCENAKIETGIDNCASMPHYPQEELLGNSVEFTMKNAATKESFEDETQLGNVQDNFERLGICGESSRLKDMREPFSLKRVIIRCGVVPCNETKLVNFRDIFERSIICWESSLFKEVMGSESLKKGTKRRDDIGSREDYTTEFSHQEKTTTASLSMPHYPQEELLGNSVEFTMENAATKESFEDETQLGNGQDDFEILGICGESSRLKDMREPFSLKKVIIRSGVIRRSLEEKEAETSSCGSLDLVGGWSDFEEENGACTKDEDCENATIETGIDNCASMPHYPKEELLWNFVESTMENAATKESFEDETQLGNGQDNFERLGICGESSRLKDMRESFSLKKVVIRSVVKRIYETLLDDIRDIWERCWESSPFKEEMGSESLKKGTKRRDDIGSREEYTTEFSHQAKTTTAKRSVGYEGKTFHLMNTSKAKEETSRQCKNHLTKGKQET